MRAHIHNHHTLSPSTRPCTHTPFRALEMRIRKEKVELEFRVRAPLNNVMRDQSINRYLRNSKMVGLCAYLLSSWENLGAAKGRGGVAYHRYIILLPCCSKLKRTASHLIQEITHLSPFLVGCDFVQIACSTGDMTWVVSRSRNRHAIPGERQGRLRTDMPRRKLRA